MISSHFKIHQINIRYVKSKYFTYPVSVVLSLFITTTLHAEQVFNPAFLSDGLSGSQISDLSKFENTTHQLPGIYRVEVSVNNEFMFTQDVNFVEKQGINDPTGLFPCFNLKTLEQFGININQYEELIASANSTCIDFLSIIEGSTSNFQFDKQKLSVTFPQISLKNQVRGYIPPEQWDAGITGLFTNYNLSGYNNSNDKSQSIFLGLDSGFNLGSWQFRNSSSFNYNSKENSSSKNWTNLNTYAQKTLVPISSQLTLGDSSSNNDIFDSFSYRGVQLASLDNMYPDSQQGYAPTVRGIAKTNAKVVIKQNGNIVQQVTVPPGPFTINDLNQTNTSGDLDITIEENDGTKQHYIIPYSTLPIFQREGRTKYNVIAGRFRSGHKFQDDPNIFQSTFAHGLGRGFSIYSGAQLSDNYQSFLLGLGSNLGHYGAVSFDITHASSTLADDSTHEGQSVRFLYAKSLITTGTTFRLLGYRYSTRGFYTLNDTAYNKMNDFGSGNSRITDYYNLNNTKKGRFEANISHSFGKKYGSIYLSGNQQTFWGTKNKNTWFQAGYANSWNDVNFSLAASYVQSSEVEQSDTQFTANVSFPLDKLFSKSYRDKNQRSRSYVTASTNQGPHGNTSYNTSVNGTLLEDNNLSYSISQGHINDRGSNGSMSVGYQGGYGNVGASYSYDKDNTQFSYNASGSALVHANGITFGQVISDTAILVKVPGAKNIKVENYTGVKTDWRGYAIVPYASAYRQNRIALDTNSFGDNVEISNNVESVVPIQGAISRAIFTANVGVRALITLSKNGEFIPYASSVIETESSSQGFVADEGRVYLTGLPHKGTLNITWGGDSSSMCSIPYDISEADLSQSIIQFELECE